MTVLGVAELAPAAGTVLAIGALVWALPAIMRREGPQVRLAPALVLVTAGAVMTFVAYIAFLLRCAHGDCHVARASGLGAVDPWRDNMHAWQWSTELVLASAGLVVASVALALVARRRRGARAALWGARALYAAWLAMVAVPALA